MINDLAVKLDRAIGFGHQSEHAWHLIIFEVLELGGGERNRAAVRVGPSDGWGSQTRPKPPCEQSQQDQNANELGANFHGITDGKLFLERGWFGIGADEGEIQNAE